jgi:hypothetical protein
MYKLRASASGPLRGSPGPSHIAPHLQRPRGQWWLQQARQDNSSPGGRKGQGLDQRRPPDQAQRRSLGRSRGVPRDWGRPQARRL